MFVLQALEVGIDLEGVSLSQVLSYLFVELRIGELVDSIFDIVGGVLNDYSSSFISWFNDNGFLIR